MDFTRKGIRRLLLLAVPLILALIGFVLVEKEPLLQSLFLSVCMYFLNYQDAPVNLWLELARWTAPLATASGVFLAIAALRRRVQSYLLFRRGKCTAVYGPDGEKAAILTQLGPEGVDIRDEFIPAQRYILLGSEEENLSFYCRHADHLADSVVYMRSRSLQAQSVSAANLRLFCPEETAARLFWKRCFLYNTSVACGHRMKIVFLGFGRLGQELLTSALQNNLFSPDQTIEYHIFGSDGGFADIHRELNAISDPVVFHTEPWHSYPDLLEEAQAVIVLEQDDQLFLLRELLLACRRPIIHVFAANATGAQLLAGKERLELFPWQEEAGKLENILSDRMYLRAKSINLRYACLYSGAEDTPREREAQWQQLDAFTRYSNISSADYHEMQLRILEAEGLPANPEALPPEWMEYLAELEHLRWCRYHQLNNWRHGIPANGKNKDMSARIHVDLVPYSSLTDGEKEKDRENIRILFSIQ